MQKYFNCLGRLQCLLYIIVNSVINIDMHHKCISSLQKYFIKTMELRRAVI